MKQIALAALLLLAGCTANKSDSAPKKSIVVVICDTSESTTLDSADSHFNDRISLLKQALVTIPKLYNYGSKIYYYPISENRLCSALCTEVSYKARTKSEIGNDTTRVNEVMANLLTQIDNQVPLTQNSCIVFSLKAGLDNIQTLFIADPDAGYDYNLVIVSDMLEDCTKFSGTKIQMRLSDRKRFTEGMAQLAGEKLTLPNGMPDFKLWTVLVSPAMDNRVDELKHSWKQYFLNSGISEKNILITAGIPSNMPRKIQY